MKSGVSSGASLFFELFLINVLCINKVLLSLIQETNKKSNYERRRNLQVSK